MSTCFICSVAQKIPLWRGLQGARRPATIHACALRRICTHMHGRPVSQGICSTALLSRASDSADVWCERVCGPGHRVHLEVRAIPGVSWHRRQQCMAHCACSCSRKASTPVNPSTAKSTGVPSDNHAVHLRLRGQRLCHLASDQSRTITLWMGMPSA